MNIRPKASAFTLLEVIIAVALFFIGMFSILQLTNRGLRMAKALQQDRPSPAMVASELSLTNRLEDGATYSGDFSFLVPEIYPQYTWSAQTYEILSNGLFQADIVVEGVNSAGRPVESQMSILLFRPGSTVRGLAPGFNRPVN